MPVHNYHSFLQIDDMVINIIGTNFASSPDHGGFSLSFSDELDGLKPGIMSTENLDPLSAADAYVPPAAKKSRKSTPDAPFNQFMDFAGTNLLLQALQQQQHHQQHQVGGRFLGEEAEQILGIHFIGIFLV